MVSEITLCKRNVPNDAECAMEVLRERTGKAQAAQEDVSDMAERRSLSVSDMPRNPRTKSVSGRKRASQFSGLSLT